RARLRDLEDRYDSGERDLEREIVETSLRFGVLCRFTAFVAVDSRVVADGGPGHRVIQPVEQPSGWGPSAPPPTAVPMAFAAAAFGAPAGSPPGGAASRAAFGAPPVPGGPARGFAPVRRAMRGSIPGGAPMDVDPAALAAEELARLREAAGTSPYERRTYLADLASRLRVLAFGHPELTALAEELAAAEEPGTDLD